MTPHPSFFGDIIDAVADKEGQWPVVETETIFDTPYIVLAKDTINSAHGEFERTVVRPNNAVGILAVDDDGRILLIGQYRHPTGSVIIEIPAGTRDVPGEDPLQTAQRELAEETDLLAENVEPLLNLTMTPGYSSERLTVFLATGLKQTPTTFGREHEEADLSYYWMTPANAIAAIEKGLITDAKTVAAIYAYDRRSL